MSTNDDQITEAPHPAARDREVFTAGDCMAIEFEAEATFGTEAVGGNFLMVDDVNASLMPFGFPAAAFYVGGSFANHDAVAARQPHVMAPTMLRPFTGSLKTIPEWQHGVSWDIEPSLFVPDQAGGLVKMTRAQGVFPHLYCPLSQAVAVCASVHAAGFSYNDFGLHTAHWTMQPHICSGISTVFGTVTARSTQFTDLYLGRSLDCSLCAPGYLGPFGGSPSATFPLKVGSQGNEVRRVQRALDARGFSLTQDGNFGPKTEGAVKLWQQGKRHVTGEITSDDWAFMLPTLSLASKNHWPGATKALQRMLDWHGYHLESRPEGKDGTFGSFTNGAVKQFQRQHGLQVDGVVGPATYAKL